jgi:hypothetical protein
LGTRKSVNHLKVTFGEMIPETGGIIGKTRWIIKRTGGIFIKTGGITTKTRGIFSGANPIRKACSFSWGCCEVL